MAFNRFRKIFKVATIRIGKFQTIVTKLSGEFRFEIFFRRTNLKISRTKSDILRQKTQNIEVKKYCISQIKERGSFRYQN